MKAVHIIVLVVVITIGTVSLVCSAGPSNERARSAYRQVLQEADKDKDGKLSMAECKAMFKSSAQGEKNCGFWDANHDGIITEDEYVSQVMSLQRKR